LRTTGRYRVWNEAESRPANGWDDRWDLVVFGRGGFIAPWGDGTLAACTKASETTKKILADVPGSWVAQDGSDGQNVVFPAGCHGPVAELLRVPRRKPTTALKRRVALGKLAAVNRTRKTTNRRHLRARQSLQESRDDSQAI
jgi:hypothetical protein